MYGVGVCVCMSERERECKINLDLFNTCYTSKCIHAAGNI